MFVSRAPMVESHSLSEVFQVPAVVSLFIENYKSVGANFQHKLASRKSPEALLPVLKGLPFTSLSMAARTLGRPSPYPANIVNLLLDFLKESTTTVLTFKSHRLQAREIALIISAIKECNYHVQSLDMDWAVKYRRDKCRLSEWRHSVIDRNMAANLRIKRYLVLDGQQDEPQTMSPICQLPAELRLMIASLVCPQTGL